MLRRPPLARPRGPTGVVVQVREVAEPRSRRWRGSWSGRQAWPSWALEPMLAPRPARRCRCHGDRRPGRGRSASSCINRFPSGDPPVSGDRGLCSCAGPAGAVAQERRGRERVVQSLPRSGLAGPGLAQVTTAGTARRRTPEGASSVVPRFFAPLQPCSPSSDS
ncbi:uncharacterized protein LOC144578648 [Callithrix jacchus]